MASETAEPPGNRSHDAVVFAEGTLPNGTPVDALDRRHLHLEFGCAGGRRIVGDWGGVPLMAILEAAGAPASTTHLLVDARDGSRACVAIAHAVNALLALSERREGHQPADRATPRLVGDRIDSLRSLKRVTRIATVRLSPHEDATELERLGGGPTHRGHPDDAS